VRVGVVGAVWARGRNFYTVWGLSF